jgi:hypothetical protein
MNGDLLIRVVATRRATSGGITKANKRQPERIVQRSRNTWVGIISYAVFNAISFVITISGLGT